MKPTSHCRHADDKAHLWRAVDHDNLLDSLSPPRLPRTPFPSLTALTPRDWNGWFQNPATMNDSKSFTRLSRKTRINAGVDLESIHTWCVWETAQPHTKKCGLRPLSAEARWYDFFSWSAEVVANGGHDLALLFTYLTFFFKICEKREWGELALSKTTAVEMREFTSLERRQVGNKQRVNHGDNEFTPTRKVSQSRTAGRSLLYVYHLKVDVSGVVRTTLAVSYPQLHQTIQ